MKASNLFFKLTTPCNKKTGSIGSPVKGIDLSGTSATIVFQFYDSPRGGK